MALYTGNIYRRREVGMPFHINYHRGSFSFRESCGTREDALLRVLALKAAHGVWHIHIEDEQGGLVLHGADIDEARASA